MDYNIALIGGDLRSASLALMLAKDGFVVKTYGLNLPDDFEKDRENIRIYTCTSLEEAISGADVVIGPIPFSRDKGQTLNSPLCDAKIYISDFEEALRDTRIFIAGKISESFKSKMTVKGVSVYDVLERDDFAILNAVPTAEGTVQIAMEELPATIWNMKVLVLGAGRVGRCLANLLKAMGADVTVAVRKGKDAAWAVSNKLQYCGYDFDNGFLKNFRLICNTVPAVVLDENALCGVSKEALIVDLASDSGGVDYCFALSNEIKVVHALSLPGKVAPKTAAENIKRVVYNIIAEDKKR